MKLTIILAAAAALAVSVVASAETPGRHPRYIHARSDLRTAQWLLRVHDEDNVMRHVRRVDDEINQAVAELDRASVIDHKDVFDHPSIDRSLDRPGRLHKALELLKAARADISQEEDNPRALAWRDAAYGHIDAAIDQLHKALRDLRIDRMEGY
jgi:hypothetical protein